MRFLGEGPYEWSAENQSLSTTGTRVLHRSPLVRWGTPCPALQGWLPPQPLGKPPGSPSWWMGRRDGRRGSVAGAEAVCEHVFLEEESACTLLAGEKKSAERI